MAGDDAFSFVLAVIVVGVIALVAVAIFSQLLSSPVALDPGDPLYDEQRGIAETVTGLLPLMIPGAVAVAAIFIAAFARSGR